MSNRKIHIGLDFGTKQSKACIYDIDKDKREFFLFENGTFFLPSKVGLKPSGKFVYGDIAPDEVIKEFPYFKIAAAEDEAILQETQADGRIEDLSYMTFDYGALPPEFLAVVYVTYLLFTIKEHYRNSQAPKQRSGGLLSRARKQEASSEIVFSVQMGIPTEWSQKKNLRRKRKFENILLISEELQRFYRNRKNYLEASGQEIRQEVRRIYEQIKAETSHKTEFDEMLHAKRVAVFPETAAGLSFILQSRQLNPGFYAAMDVGAGSTDVSYFRLIDNQRLKYIASESYLLGANTIYRKFKKGTDSLEALQGAEAEFNTLLAETRKRKNKKGAGLWSALTEVDQLLEKKAKALYSRRVRFFQENINHMYDRQPIIMYGGGAQFPILDTGKYRVWHGGNLDNEYWHVYINKRRVASFFANIPNLQFRKGEEADLPLLAVALGLSFIQHNSAADWFDESQYIDRDRDRETRLIPHPVNEDCYIYDVLERKFYDGVKLI